MVCSVTVLLLLGAGRDIEQIQRVLEQYMEVTWPWIKLDETSGRLNEKWSASDEMDLSDMHDVAEEDVKKVREWYGVERIQSLMCSTQHVRGILVVDNFTGKTPRSPDLFYFAWVYRDCTAGESRVETDNRKIGVINCWGFIKIVTFLWQLNTKPG